MEKVCPYCKEAFECNDTSMNVCGCEQADVAAEIKQYIKDTYVCLCSSCMKHVKDSFYIYGVNPTYRKVKRMSTSDY